MKIEAGRRYVTRGGWVTPPIASCSFDHYPWSDTCGGVTWTENGKEYESDCSPMDLVAEYVEPTPAEASRLEIAARVLAGFAASGALLNMECDENMALAFADALIAAERETRK